MGRAGAAARLSTAGMPRTTTDSPRHHLSRSPLHSKCQTRATIYFSHTEEETRAKDLETYTHTGLSVTDSTLSLRQSKSEGTRLASKVASVGSACGDESGQDYSRTFSQFGSKRDNYASNTEPQSDKSEPEPVISLPRPPSRAMAEMNARHANTRYEQRRDRREGQFPPLG